MIDIFDGGDLMESISRNERVAIAVRGDGRSFLALVEDFVGVLAEEFVDDYRANKSYPRSQGEHHAALGLLIGKFRTVAAQAGGTRTPRVAQELEDIAASGDMADLAEFAQIEHDEYRDDRSTGLPFRSLLSQIAKLARKAAGMRRSYGATMGRGKFPTAQQAATELSVSAYVAAAEQLADDMDNAFAIRKPLRATPYTDLTQDRSGMVLGIEVNAEPNRTRSSYWTLRDPTHFEIAWGESGGEERGFAVTSMGAPKKRGLMKTARAALFVPDSAAEQMDPAAEQD